MQIKEELTDSWDFASGGRNYGSTTEREKPQRGKRRRKKGASGSIKKPSRPDRESFL